MKNNILIYLGLAVSILFSACTEDTLNPENYTPEWSHNATLKFAPAGDASGQFEYHVEAYEGGTEYWNVTDVNLDVAVDLGGFTVDEIAKIDIYLFVEEDLEGGFNYLGGEQGKLISTVEDPTETFEITISKEDIEGMYGTDFSDNHNGNVTVSDLFELKWVFTGVDGKIYDSRSDCSGFNCTYAFGTNVIQIAPPIWEGTFEYEWIEATAGALNYGRITIGQTGTMTMSLQEGSYTVYDVSHLGADYYYGGPGVLDYDYQSGAVTIIDPSWRAQVWNITDVNGPTITIEWSYYYSAGYDEYGTFTLTRTDGQDWPTNIHTD